MRHPRATAVATALATAAAAVLTALAATPAAAQTTNYYVSPTAGVDTNAGTSAAAPFRTLQKALDVARPGVTINLGPGVYREAVSTRVAGTADAPITVRGPEQRISIAGPETPLDLSGRDKAVLYGLGGRVFGISHSWYTLDGFTIDGQADIARSEYPTSLAAVRAWKDSVQGRAKNSKLVYVGAADTSRDVVGTRISNMFLTGSGGECVRFRNRAANSLVVDTVIRYCGVLGQGVEPDQYKYHNAEGVYIGTSPKSTNQPLPDSDTSNDVVVRNSRIDTFGSECFEVKENAHHNRIENSWCGFNDEPLSFQGSNVELRGDNNLVLNTRLYESRSWNLKLASDSAAYDRGGNAAQRSSFSGAAGPAIVNRQAAAGRFCGNTFVGTASEGNGIGDPRAACPDTTAPTAPTALTATAVSTTSVALRWTASVDDVGVESYAVLRGTTQVGTTATTSYTDAGLTAGTAYRYTVVARDAAGNVSPASAALPVTTTATPPPATTPPATTPPATTPPTTVPPATTPPATVPPAAGQPIALEAEAGAVTAPMAVRADTQAQGGRYVSQTAPSGTGRVTFTGTVPAAGRYVLSGRVIAPNASSDSFTVSVNGGPAVVWTVGTRTAWTTVTGPTLSLRAGSNTLVIAKREAGARLDAIRLTPAP